MSGSPSQLSALGVRWAEFPRPDASLRRRWWRSDRGVERTRRILDWTIDGVGLRELLARPGGETPDEVTLMADDLRDDGTVIGSLRALLGEDVAAVEPYVTFIDGRAAVLFCPQCGDLACGAVSVEVRFEGPAVVWGDIGYQTALGEERVIPHAPAISVRFDRTQYEATLRTLLAVWST